MTAHLPLDRELHNQEAIDLVVALRRCLTNFHNNARETAILPAIDDQDRAALTKYLRARKVRHSIFGNGLFADPAWDIMLELYDADLAGRPASIDSLCDALGVSAVTLDRHVTLMHSRGLLLSGPDADAAPDGSIRLSPIAIDGMTSWVQLMFGAESGPGRVAVRR